MKLFGKAKKSPTPRESISKMKETVEMLEKREAFLQNKINHEVQEAKKFMLAKNKKAAMMCLKRKKTYEQQIDKIAGARLTIDTQVSAIEGANVSLEAMNAMKMGAQTMKDIHKNITVEVVDNTMDLIRDQMDIANEINDAISQPLGNTLFDEDELNAELEALEQEDLDQQFLSIQTPSVPVAKVASPVAQTASRQQAAAAADEDAELRALEESMAL